MYVERTEWSVTMKAYFTHVPHFCSFSPTPDLLEPFLFLVTTDHFVAMSLRENNSMRRWHNGIGSTINNSKQRWQGAVTR